MERLEGCYVAMITPFNKDASVNVEGVKTLVNYFVEQGVTGILASGTTGESATMSHKEDLLVIKTVLDEVNGRVKVIAGTGSNSTASALEYTKDAVDMGVDYALVVCPYYNKPPQEGLIKHFSLIAEKNDMPIIMYNVPGRTGGKGILADTAITLGNEFENIVGIKWASSDLKQAEQIINGTNDDFSLMSGEDDLTYEMMLMGGRGVISATANIIPKQFTEMVTLMLKGEKERAKELHEKYVVPASKAAFMETNPIPAKTAINMIGLPGGEFRLPLCKMSSDKEEQLKQTLKELGLLK
jgi:4-hydroxy-tetrahydrodipicolinate synthase